MLDVSSEEITDGNLGRAMFVLAVPLVVQNLVRVGEAVADLFWLGRLSSAAVSGVGLAVPIYTLLTAAVFFPTFVGTQVLVSQRVGSGDDVGAQSAAVAGVVAALVVGTVVGLAGFLAVDPLVSALASVDPGATGAAVERAAVQYLRVSLLGVALLAVTDVVEAVYVGHGDSRASLYMNLVAVLGNVALDPLLIFGVGPFPRLEVYGAALATIGGSAAGLLIGIGFYLGGRQPGMFSWATAEVDLAEVRELLDVGAPTAGQQVARQAGNLLMVVVVFLTGGGAGLAAYHIGYRVSAISFTPAIGCQQAVQSVVGQNLGAANPGRANRATWLSTGAVVGLLGVVGSLQWLFPAEVTTLLVPTIDPGALELSVAYLRILAYGYPAIGAAYLLEAGFNGARRTEVGFVTTALQFYAVRLPVAAGVGLLLGAGVEAVFWAVTASNALAAVGLAGYYYREVAAGMLDRAVEAT